MRSLLWLVSLLVLITLSTFVLWMSTLAQTPSELAGSWSVSIESVTPGQEGKAQEVEGKSATIKVDQTYPDWPLEITNDRNQTTRGKLKGSRIATTQAEDLPETRHWPEQGIEGTLSKEQAAGQYVITLDQHTAGMRSIWRKQGPLAALPPSTAGSSTQGCSKAHPSRHTAPRWWFSPGFPGGSGSLGTRTRAVRRALDRHP